MSRGEGNLPPVSELTGMDGMFGKTNMVVLILFGFCCGYIALILGIVGLITCQDPRAKQNALIVTIIAGILSAIGTVANVIRLMGQ
jgi:uncharacterized membrane protein